MMPHEQYPPPPKNSKGSRLTFMDYMVIGATSFGIYSSFLMGSVINLLFVYIAWRMWERYRSEDE